GPTPILCPHLAHPVTATHILASQCGQLCPTRLFEGGVQMNRRDLFISSAKAALATAFGSSWFGSTASAQTPQPAGGAAATPPMERTILPIPEPKPPTIDVLDARNVIPPGRFEVKAPPNAPNVLIVLLDDMGFGQSSAFGGPVNMPALERLASEGLSYNQFHTTALCSPT